jgi:guanylate kinase
VQGVVEYESIDPNVQAIFILPPSYEAWQNRLKSRYEESDISPEDIKRRMRTADAELQEGLQKNYFRFVINDDLDKAVAAVDAIAHGVAADNGPEAARKLAEELLAKL